MGTYAQGLHRLDVQTGEIVVYKNDPNVSGSLSNNQVNALCVDHAGTLWVGTQNGLDRFDRNTGKFTTVGERDGLPNNAVEGILEDSAGNLWLSTDNGLSKFDPLARTFKNYFSEDGLPGDEFNDSSVYFKTAKRLLNNNIYKMMSFRYFLSHARLCGHGFEDGNIGCRTAVVASVEYPQ